MSQPFAPPDQASSPPPELQEGASLASKEERRQQRLAREREAQRLKEERAVAQRQAEQARVAQVAIALQAWWREQGIGADRFDLAAYDALQSGPLLRDFKDVHGAHPSPTALRRIFDLSPAVHEQLAAHQRELERRARERKLAQHRWEQGLVGYDEALELLCVTKAELDEWTALQRVPVALHRTLRKGSQQSLQMLFEPAALKAISEEQIAHWREIDLQTLPPEDRSARARSVAKIQARRRLTAALDATQAAHGCEVREQDGSLVFTQAASVPVPVAVSPGEVQDWQAVVVLQARLPMPKVAGEAGNLPARVGAAFAPDKLAGLGAAIANAVADLVAEYGNAL